MEEEKKKRTSPVRAGNVYTLELPDGQRAVFHFLVRDIHDLNSPIIRVFRKRYQPDEIISVDEALKDEIDFYCHVFLQPGIWDGKIVKIGYRKFTNTDEINDIYFLRNRVGLQLFGTPEDWKRAKNYTLWTINQRDFYVYEIPEHIINSGKLCPDDVMYYGSVIKRCVDGHWDPRIFPERFWPKNNS